MTFKPSYSLAPIGSKAFWGMVEYRKSMDDYNGVKRGIKPIHLPALEKAVPLSHIRQKKETIKEGFVTERRAGKYLERRVRKVQSSGGLIRRLPFEYPFGKELPFKPYVLSKDIYCDTETGEEILPDRKDWHWCKDYSSRNSDPKQVKKTCENFKWLVRANERHIRLFVTLTYAENMTDTKRLYDDYRKFVQRLKRAYKQIDGYLVAFEPQSRGAWHAHILLISHDAFLYIPNKKMHQIWGHGFTKVQRVKHIRDIGSYLTAYLTNLKEGNRTKKGKRLEMYPRGFHFLRSSRDGISRTDVNKWFGRFDEISYPGEIELIYDYEHCRPLDREGQVMQVTKIFCFKKKENPPLRGD